MTNEELIAEARRDISDAERCGMLGVTPAHGTLLRTLRKVTDALEASDARIKELEGVLAFDISADQELIEAQQRIAELEAGVTGKIVTASFEDGKTRVECGLEGCECPEHDWPVMPAGTYITVRLDEDCPVGLFRVRVHTLPVESEGEEA